MYKSFSEYQQKFEKKENEVELTEEEYNQNLLFCHDLRGGMTALEIWHIFNYLPASCIGLKKIATSL